MTLARRQTRQISLQLICAGKDSRKVARKDLALNAAIESLRDDLKVKLPLALRDGGVQVSTVKLRK